MPAELERGSTKPTPSVGHAGTPAIGEEVAASERAGFRRRTAVRPSSASATFGAAVDGRLSFGD